MVWLWARMPIQGRSSTASTCKWVTGADEDIHGPSNSDVDRAANARHTTGGRDDVREPRRFELAAYGDYVGPIGRRPRIQSADSLPERRSARGAYHHRALGITGLLPGSSHHQAIS